MRPVEPRLFDQPQRGDRGLAGAGWGDEQGRSVSLERIRQFREDVDDGKVSELRRAAPRSSRVPVCRGTARGRRRPGCSG